MQFPDEVIDTLALKNPHERDQHIEFDPIPHLYTIYKNPNTKYTSVTTYVHSHFSHFNANSIIDKMFGSKSWGPNHKYWGQTREDIKKSWDKNRDEASSAGTDMHYRIECFHNMTNVPYSEQKMRGPTYKDLYAHYIAHYYAMSDDTDTNTTTTKEWKYFLEYVKDHPDFMPYRTEWMVFYEELQLSGSIDMIYELPTGELMIYDWKRAKEIKQQDNFHNHAKTKCIEHLPDTNYWHYTLQLNVYKMILEAKYEKKVKELCLVVLHPDNYNESYLLYPVPIIEQEISDLCKIRMKQLIT